MDKIQVISYHGRFIAYTIDKSSGALHIVAVYEPYARLSMGERHRQEPAGILHVAWGVPTIAHDNPVDAILAARKIETTHMVYLTPKKLVFISASNVAECSFMESEIDAHAKPPSELRAASEVLTFRDVFLQMVFTCYGSDHVALYKTGRPTENASGELVLERLEDCANTVMDIVLANYDEYKRLMADRFPVAYRALGDVCEGADALPKKLLSAATVTKFASARVRMFYLEGRYYAVVASKEGSNLVEIVAIYAPDRSVPHGLLNVAWGAAEPGNSVMLTTLLAARACGHTHTVGIYAGKLRIARCFISNTRYYVTATATPEDSELYVLDMESPQKIREFRERFRSVLGATSAEAQLYFATRIKKNEAHNLRLKKLKRYARDAYGWVYKHSAKFVDVSAPFVAIPRHLAQKTAKYD